MGPKGSSVYVRNVVFGVEDGLVSTVGFLSGIAAAGIPSDTIFLTGMVLIFVEAFSMAVGSLLSEHEGEEVFEKKEIPLSRAFNVAIVMFLSYFFAGFLSLLPYIIFSGNAAIIISIAVTLIALFVLGFIIGRKAQIPAIKQGLQMLILGGVAVLVGVVVGRILE